LRQIWKFSGECLSKNKISGEPWCQSVEYGIFARDLCERFWLKK